jgi:hypothetical protein
LTLRESTTKPSRQREKKLKGIKLLNRSIAAVSFHFLPSCDDEHTWKCAKVYTHGAIWLNKVHNIHVWFTFLFHESKHYSGTEKKIIRSVIMQKRTFFFHNNHKMHLEWLKRDHGMTKITVGIIYWMQNNRNNIDVDTWPHQKPTPHYMCSDILFRFLHFFYDRYENRLKLHNPWEK